MSEGVEEGAAPSSTQEDAAALIETLEEARRCVKCLTHNTRLPEWCPFRETPCIVHLHGRRVGELPGPIPHPRSLDAGDG